MPVNHGTHQNPYRSCTAVRGVGGVERPRNPEGMPARLRVAGTRGRQCLPGGHGDSRRTGFGTVHRPGHDERHRPPNAYTLHFEGQGGAAGFARGEARITLAPEGDRQTSLHYAAKAQVGGKLAQIGSRLVDGAAAKLADDFFASFARYLAPAEPATASAAEPVGADAPYAPRAWVRWAAIAGIIVLLGWLAAKGGFRF